MAVMTSSARNVGMYSTVRRIGNDVRWLYKCTSLAASMETTKIVYSVGIVKTCLGFGVIARPSWASTLRTAMLRIELVLQMVFNGEKYVEKEMRCCFRKDEEVGGEMDPLDC